MHEIEISHSVASFLCRRRALGFHGSVKRGLRDLISFSFLCRVMSATGVRVKRVRRGAESCGPAGRLWVERTLEIFVIFYRLLCAQCRSCLKQLFKDFPVTETKTPEPVEVNNAILTTFAFNCTQL